MNNTGRISWKYGVSLDGIKRGMPLDDIKHTIVSNPKNARLAGAISKLDPTYVRKAVSVAAGWYRKPKARRSIVVTRPAATSDNQKQSRVTFMIAGCQITVPTGVSVEVI